MRQLLDQLIACSHPSFSQFAQTALVLWGFLLMTFHWKYMFEKKKKNQFDVNSINAFFQIVSKFFFIFGFSS